MKKHLQPEDYLKKILTARVYDVAIESPLEPARALSRRLHNKVLLKREEPAARLQLQAARRLQQDGPSVAGAAAAAVSSAPPPGTTRRASPCGASHGRAGGES
jgi:hypothetical protein